MLHSGRSGRRSNSSQFSSRCLRVAAAPHVDGHWPTLIALSRGIVVHSLTNTPRTPHHTTHEARRSSSCWVVAGSTLVPLFFSSFDVSLRFLDPSSNSEKRRKLEEGLRTFMFHSQADPRQLAGERPLRPCDAEAMLIHPCEHAYGLECGRGAGFDPAKYRKARAGRGRGIAARWCSVWFVFYSTLKQSDSAQQS